jgi:anti-anti-sigma factor
MNLSMEDRQGCVLLSIPEAFTIYEVDDIRKTMIDCFASHDGIILKMDAVSECDTAGIQLLCSARATARAQGKRFEVEGVSEPLMKTIQACGLTLEKLFGLTEEA